jgi:uncharacterized oxidoreductase
MISCSVTSELFVLAKNRDNHFRGDANLPVLSADVLNDFSKRLFLAGGLDQEAAEIVSNSLVEANLRGHDSHGVMRIPFYIGRVADGGLNPKSRLTIVKESASSIMADGGWGMGQVLTRDLMNRLIEKCKTSAVAFGTLIKSSHIGRLGEYAEMAADAGFASIMGANTHGAAQRVAPIGGKRPRLGTNPICMGMPGGKNGPFIFDIGTSATAEGKVRVKKIAGQTVPGGWLLDPDGRPTIDPNQLYGDPPGTILPLGGDQAYKGFGLAFMVEMFSGAISGGQCAYPNPPPPIGNAAFFLVLNPEFFGGLPHLNDEIVRLEEYVRGVPRIDGVEEIFLPGDPERRAMQNRRAHGIPIDDGNWKALADLALKLKVDLPTL